MVSKLPDTLIGAMAEYTYNYPEVAERIRWHRKHLGLTQAGYAQKIGATREQVKNWEAGLARPGWDTALEMRRVYAISLEWLIAGGEAGMPSDLLSAWNTRPDATSSQTI
jgi:transcriptional regulator with XRE-family HTH domain